MFDFLKRIKKAFEDGERYGFQNGFRIGLQVGRQLESGGAVIIGDYKSIKEMLAQQGSAATVEDIERMLDKR